MQCSSDILLFTMKLWYWGGYVVCAFIKGYPKFYCFHIYIYIYNIYIYIYILMTSTHLHASSPIST